VKERMNKKALSIAITLFSLTMLATTLVGSVQACGCGYWRRRIVEPYYVTYTVQPIQMGTSEIKGDYCITTGAVMQGAYDGPVGTGTMTAELIVSVTNTVTGNGWTTFKNTLELTDGPYGPVTLVGFTVFTAEGGVLVSGRTFLCGKSALGFIYISAEKGYGTSGIWEDGWISHPVSHP
jgi:hypothetical protein